MLFPLRECRQATQHDHAGQDRQRQVYPKYVAPAEVIYQPTAQRRNGKGSDRRRYIEQTCPLAPLSVAIHVAQQDET